MAITYEVPVLQEGDKSVLVTFKNEEGKIYERHINVPYINGTVDALQWANFLKQHISSVSYKASVGVITFVDPVSANNANTVEPPSDPQE